MDELPKKRNMTQKQLDNLKPTQFRPGQSGNPSGRPKRKPVTDALLTLLDKDLPGDKHGRKYAEALAQKLLLGALANGKVGLEFLREVLDRTEGKAMQASELSGPGGGPIPFEVPGDREELERRIAALLANVQKGK